MQRAALVSLLAFLAACGSDHNLTGMCGTPIDGFDIEDVSVLQDAQGYGHMHDAIVLDFDTSGVSEGATWRVGAVDVLVMIGASEFDRFADGQTLTVEVWDSEDPYSAPWQVSQVFDKDALEWEDVTLDNPTEALERDQRSAWWTFEFGEQIPTTGMTSSRYLAGIAWDGSGEPTLGYSNFNRPCDRNWTDYGDGFGWVLNSFFGGQNTCSWPMMRVVIEEIEERTECTGGSVAVE